MKWLQLGAALAGVLALLALAVPLPIQAQAGPETVTIPVTGMTWVACEGLVESAVNGLPGIIEARASYPKGSVVVQYDPEAVTPAEIAGAIVTETYFTVGEPVAGGEFSEDESIVVAGATAVIKVEGMTDDRTASLVTQAVGGVDMGGPPGTAPAIRDVSLDTAQSTLMVTYDSEKVSAQELVDAVNRETDFRASLVSTADADGGGVDYTPYIVLGIAGLFVAALAWPAVVWGRRQLAGETPSRATRRRRRRRRR